MLLRLIWDRRSEYVWKIYSSLKWRDFVYLNRSYDHNTHAVSTSRIDERCQLVSELVLNSLNNLSYIRLVLRVWFFLLCVPLPKDLLMKPAIEQNIHFLHLVCYSLAIID